MELEVLQKTELAKFDSLKAEAKLLVADVERFRVTDADSSVRAKAKADEIAFRARLLEKRRVEIVKPFLDTKRMIDEYVGEIEEILLGGTKILDVQLRAYANEQDRIRQEAARKLEEQRRAEAARLDAERRAREETAERERQEARRAQEAIAADARRAAEQVAREQREAAAAFGIDEDAEERARVEAQLNASREAALAKQREEDERFAQSERERLAGVARLEREAGERDRELARQQKELEKNAVSNTRRPWTFKIIDPAAVPREFCEPVDKLIREAVVKRGVREMPGVEIFQDTKIAYGGKGARVEREVG